MILLNIKLSSDAENFVLVKVHQFNSRILMILLKK